MSLGNHQKQSDELINKALDEARAGTEGARVIAVAIAAHAAAMLAVSDAIQSVAGALAPRSRGPHP